MRRHLDKFNLIIALLLMAGTLTAAVLEQVNTTSTQTLSNKTLASPVFSGTVTGTYALGGSPSMTSATLTTPTIASPTFSGTAAGSLTSLTLVTPALGTPASGTLTNATGLPISTGVSGLGTGVATFLATPSSANLIAAVTNETGSGSLVFQTSPVLNTPTIASPTISGAPVIPDNVFTVVGSADATKKVAFEVDGLTTITTRTMTVPDKSMTLGTVLMSPVATTTGTTIDFTSIPAGVRVITFMMSSGVSTNGTTNMILQIGDSGGIESSGYVSYAFESGSFGVSPTSGFGLTSSITASTAVSGVVTLTLENASANTWVMSGNLFEEGLSLISASGRKSLSATLDRVRLTTTGSDTFDAGEVNVAYQF